MRHNSHQLVVGGSTLSETFLFVRENVEVLKVILDPTSDIFLTLNNEMGR